MKSHIKLGRIRGVELGLHYSWLIIAALITISLAAHFRSTNSGWSTAAVWITAVVTGLLFFACLFAHELSHAMVAKARGLPIRQITLFILGGVAQIEREAQDAATEFWVAIAGPLTSAGVGLFCLGLVRVFSGWHMGTQPQAPLAAVLLWLGYINLTLAAFNLIPGFPMDGGRVLRAILWWITGDGDKATHIAARVGQVVGWFFVVLGTYRMFTGVGIGGLWIALIGWFIIQAAGGILMQAKANALLRGLTVRDVMWRDCARVDAAQDVQRFVDLELTRGEQRCFLVLDHGLLVGLVSQDDVRKVPHENWRRTTLRQITRPLARVQAVTPDTSLPDAMERMAREEVGELLVISEGSLQGVVSRNSILHALQVRSDLKAA